jgi:hypothetical protein
MRDTRPLCNSVGFPVPVGGDAPRLPSPAPGVQHHLPRAVYSVSAIQARFPLLLYRVRVTRGQNDGPGGQDRRVVVLPQGIGPDVCRR